jgi:hypothetical protein
MTNAEAGPQAKPQARPQKHKTSGSWFRAILWFLLGGVCLWAASIVRPVFDPKPMAPAYNLFIQDPWPDPPGATVLRQCSLRGSGRYPTGPFSQRTFLQVDKHIALDISEGWRADKSNLLGDILKFYADHVSKNGAVLTSSHFQSGSRDFYGSGITYEASGRPRFPEEVSMNCATAEGVFRLRARMIEPGHELKKLLKARPDLKLAEVRVYFYERDYTHRPEGVKQGGANGPLRGIFPN